MMNEIDLGIVKARRKKMKSRCKTLDSGIYVGETLLRFRPIRLLDDQLSVQLPVIFLEMDSRSADHKYPSDFRPQTIWMNPEKTVNFTFNFFEPLDRAQDLSELAKQMRAMVERLSPANVFYDVGRESAGAAELAWFDYKSYGLDQQLYQWLYFITFSRVFVQGGFSCTACDQQEWKPIVQLVLSSMEEIQNTEGNDTK